MLFTVALKIVITNTWKVICSRTTYADPRYLITYQTDSLHTCTYGIPVLQCCWCYATELLKIHGAEEWFQCFRQIGMAVYRGGFQWSSLFSQQLVRWYVLDLWPKQCW